MSVPRDASERAIRRGYIAVLAIFLALVATVTLLIVWTATHVHFRG